MIPAALVIAIVLLLLLDLHTTSEIIKRGAGKEANPVLGVLNASTSWHKRFWILAAVKFISIAAVVAGAWYARNEELTPYVLAILASFYAYVVLVNNLPIYWKAKG